MALHAPAQIVKASFSQIAVAHIDRHRGRRALGLQNADKLVTLRTIDRDSDIDHFKLLLDTLDKSVYCLNISVKIVHCHVEPLDVNDLVAKFLSNLHAQSFQIVK